MLVWATASTLWLANSVRTQGVDDHLLQSSSAVTVTDGPTMLAMQPLQPREAALVFFCGAGIAAQAYVPLLRPIADGGYPVFIVKLPFRFAPLESHRGEAIARARRVIESHPATPRWVLSGHSLGAALAARLATAPPSGMAALVLIGTTHPRDHDLSTLSLPVTKIYGANDGVAPVDDVLRNAPRLPASTRWVKIDGGNHSQFGHYGRQLFDGGATISREAQQGLTRQELLLALATAAR